MFPHHYCGVKVYEAYPPFTQPSLLAFFLGAEWRIFHRPLQITSGLLASLLHEASRYGPHRWAWPLAPLAGDRSKGKRVYSGYWFPGTPPCSFHGPEHWQPSTQPSFFLCISFSLGFGNHSFPIPASGASCLYPLCLLLTFSFSIPWPSLSKMSLYKILLKWHNLCAICFLPEPWSKQNPSNILHAKTCVWEMSSLYSSPPQETVLCIMSSFKDYPGEF